MADSRTAADRASWIEKEFRSNVSPGMRNLAEALQLLCRCLLPGEPTKDAGKRLTQAKAALRIPCAESSLSRFLSGQTMPALAIVKSLHREASCDAGGEHLVAVTLDELKLLHKRAETERRCRGCAELAAEVDTLTLQLREAEAERAALQQEVGALSLLRDEVAVLRVAIEELEAVRAGLRVRPTARSSPGPLPVPRRRGDRQRMRRDLAAVRNLAEQAEKLDSDGRAGAALTLLRRSTEVLNPLETAGVVLLLREQQHDELADNLIHVYGRDQDDQDVLHVALALHEQGSPEDAGAMLQAALE
ncbi:hypothetical protein [Streptomyces sp. NPDC087787]|uniref:hypothetical protein n=1 Tax=Streptomyces sp. NPDC087787 TaxID=3365803 RepID=UPI0037F79523